MHANSGLFAVYIDSVGKFLMGLAYWVEEFVTDLEQNIRQLLFRGLDMVYVAMCDKIKDIIVH